MMSDGRCLFLLEEIRENGKDESEGTAGISQTDVQRDGR